MKTGQMTEVLVKDYGVDGWLEVWAEPNQLVALEAVAGVAEVFNNHAPFKYLVIVDPRYIKDVVKVEIAKALEANQTKEK